jgi:uncharacterized protein YegL
MSVDAITAVNSCVANLMSSIVSDPIVDSKARVGIIVFSNQAEVLLPLSQSSNIVQIPGCVRSVEPARYAPVFNLLKKEIEVDVPRLKSEGFRVRRPIVLFVSGSIPTDPDEWRETLRELTEDKFQFHPNIICLGLPGSQPELLTRIATKVSNEAATENAFVFMVGELYDTGVFRELGRRLIYQVWFHNIVRSRQQPDSIFLGALGEIEGISQFFISDFYPKEFVVPGVVPSLEVMDNENGVQVLPFYIVCDEGSSMTDDAIASVNAGIGELFRAIRGDPIIDAKARVSVITFSGFAGVVLPLTQLSDIFQIPGCVRSEKSSNYASVFQLLKSQIETDVVLFRNEGFVVRRPFVLFMSVGKPGPEDWRDSLKQLTDINFRFRPNIVTFGMPGADPSVIAEVSTPLEVAAGRKESFAFLSEHGVNPGDALREIMKFTVHS